MYSKKIILLISFFCLLLINILPIYAKGTEELINKGNELLFIKCNSEEAIKCFDKAIEIDSNCMKALVGKGISLGFLDKYQEALKYIDKVLEVNPKYDYGYYGKGIVLGLQGKFEESIKHFDKALEINSKYTDAFTGKAVTLGLHGKYEEAFKYINKGLEINPNDAHLLNGKGVILLLQEKPEEAIKYFDKALKVNPIYVKALDNKGICLSFFGKYEESIKCFDEVLKINFKDSIAWSKKGNALANLKRNKEAIKCFDTAIKLDPNNSNMWFKKALALEGQGKYEEAIKCYDKTIELNPKDADAWNNKGVVLGNSEKYEEAIKCFDKAIEIDPENTNALNNKQIALDILKPNQKNQGNDKIAESNSIKIKDLKTLVIHIASLSTDSKYKGYVCFKNSMLYTYLEDLKQHLLFNYEYSNKKLKVHLSSSTIEYSDSIIREGSDIYVPLITFCETIGFQPNYNESTNTLNISKQLAASMASNLWMSYNIVWGYVKNGEGNPVSDKYVYIEDPRTHQTTGASTNYKGVYFILCGPANSGNSILYIESSKNIYISGLQAIRYDSYGSSISGGNTSEIVFITDYGLKYHMAGCRYLKDSCIARPLSYVISEGYEACEVCIGGK